MGTFKIEVQEFLARVIEIDAKNVQDAFAKVQKQYKDEKIVLDYNDFVDVSNRRVLTDHDFDFLVNSNYMFARKFSDSELGLIKRLKHNYEA